MFSLILSGSILERNCCEEVEKISCRKVRVDNKCKKERLYTVATLQGKG